MISLARRAQTWLLWELLSGLWITFTYIFKPKVTINYPFE